MSESTFEKKLCIIPARGGSKRIPRKNIKDFLGKPIIAYSIEAALNSGLFDEVMVSTDDEEIADIAKKYGATVPFLRSCETSDDYSTLADVVDEVLDRYALPSEYLYGCCILPTAPLIQQKKLIEGFNKLISGPFDSVRPIVEYPYPIQRALLLDKHGFITWQNEGYALTRSQDLVPTFYDAGQFYWFKLAYRLRSVKKGAVVISPQEAQDIDNMDDWKIAELKYQMIFE